MVGQVTSAVGAAQTSSATAIVQGQEEAFSAALGQAMASKGASANAAAQVGAPGASTWQAPWMAGISQASSYLLPKDTPTDQLGLGRPSLAEFMTRTGAGVQESVQALYGSTGSNQDYRDWTKIMASSDPLLAARQASNALYNSDIAYAPSDGAKADPTNTIARSGNFAWLDINGQKGLYAVDSQGGVLRSVNMEASSILRAAEDFGLNPSDLNGLADQLDAAGVAYKPGQQYAGSNAGVDLRDLAAGGLGAAYDWRTDANASLKGPGGAAAAASDAALADRLALTANPIVTNPLDMGGTAAGVANPGASPGTPTGGAAWSAPWMQGLDTAGQYLLPADTPSDTLGADRPTLASFMAATGAGQEASVDALYGTVGSNLDYRDWGKIMSAEDPLTAARQATNALYNSDLPYTSSQANYPDPADVIAKSGNFAWLNLDGHQGLYVIDGKDEILRGVQMDAPSILKAAESFGLDLSQLNGLADQLDAARVKYQPGQMFGAATNAGVNLRDLAAGGLGASYDWRQDVNVAAKGAGAARSLAADQSMATRLGLTQNLAVTGPSLTALSSAQAVQAATSFSALLQLSQGVEGEA